MAAPAATTLAAIFDFDGTLVDSMPLHHEAYRRVFAELGLTLEAETFYGNIGGKATETIPKFLAGRATTASVEDIHRRKKLVLDGILAHAAIDVLETAKLLPLLRPFLKMGLASSGSRPGIDVMLRRLGWNAFFDVVVTGEDVVNGKPSPDLFRLAAERLGVAPERCFAFEDTDDGVASARAAGMEVVDVRLTCPARLRRGMA